MLGPQSKQSIVKHKTRCPRCAKAGLDNSGDNLVVYEDGGQHCFNAGCGYTILSEDLREPTQTLFEHEDVLEYSSENFNKLKEHTLDTGRGYRGISDEIYQYYGVRHRYDQEGTLMEQIYPLTNTRNELCGVKIRSIDPKKFYVKGSNKGETTELFGQSVHRKSKSSTVVLAAGEADTMAAHEMLKILGSQAPAIVSSTIGEDGSKQFKAQYEFFNKFDKIVVIPDNDKAGKDALEKLALVLPRNKVFVVELPKKDTNEMLLAGLVTDFIVRYKTAKPFVPEGIIGSASIKNAVKESVNVLKIPLPPFMYKLEEMLSGGFSLESIVNIAAASGIGKSTVINELIHFWVFHSPYKIGIYTLEFSSGQYGKVLLSRHLGKKLELMTNEEQLEFLETDEVDKEMDRLFINEEGLDRFYLIEDRGGTLQQAMDQMEKLIIGCNCKVIVIDPLQDLFAGCTHDDEAKFMTWQKVMIKLYKVVFINICHTRKSNDDSKTGSNGAMISEESIQGSSTIYKSANINLLLTRNKLSEDLMEKNTTKLWMSKNRTTGVTGLCASLIYHNKSNTLYEVDDYKELYPEDFATPIPDNIEF